MVKIKIYKGHPEAVLPDYKTSGSAGADLRAVERVILQPGERAIIPTGLFMEIPVGYEVQIRPRSGLAIKHGITLINCVGTIDSDYRGEVGIPLINLSQEVYIIEVGERVAQMIVASYEQGESVVVDTYEELEKTKRGKGGFGSTGK